MAQSSRTKKGAYVLFITLRRPLLLSVGSLGKVSLPPGLYAYVGSARRGISSRLARHKRLALKKSGKCHWHIDYLLVHRHARWEAEAIFENGIECRISKRISLMSGVTVPVPGFGATDCRHGCKTHLYSIRVNTFD
jgi:Uri superfamily endonuclease